MKLGPTPAPPKVITVGTVLILLGYLLAAFPLSSARTNARHMGMALSIAFSLSGIYVVISHYKATNKALYIRKLILISCTLAGAVTLYLVLS